MSEFGKIFIVIGIILIVIGALWTWMGKIPGDIVVKKGHRTFFFPIVTCIIASIILSVIFYIIGKFR